MSEPLLHFQHVSKRFEGVLAVDDVDVMVGPGELVGLVGPNGAGKSTLFNLACGYHVATAGAVMAMGVDTRRHHPAELAQLGLGRTFQTPVAFPELTALDNVMVGSSVERPLLSAISGRWRVSEVGRTEAATALLDRVGLGGRADVDAGEMSGGELRMLEVARQLMTSPRLLLLDEPTAGVAPHLQDRLTELIRSVHDEGLAVVVVEHNLGFLLELVGRVLCMAGGRLIADGTPEQVRNDPGVIAAYLGDST